MVGKATYNSWEGHPSNPSKGSGFLLFNFCRVVKLRGGRRVGSHELADDIAPTCASIMTDIW